MPGEQKTRDNVTRPPHFNEDVTEYTEHDVGGYTDYPSAEEETPYQDMRAAPDMEDESPLRVDIGQHVPQHSPQDWAVARHLIQESTVRVAGREDNRTRLYLKNNDDTNSIYLGRGQTDSVFTMYELGPDQSLELWSQGSVWAVCQTGETAYLSIVNEFVPVDPVV